MDFINIYLPRNAKKMKYEPNIEKKSFRSAHPLFVPLKYLITKKRFNAPFKITCLSILLRYKEQITSLC